MSARSSSLLGYGLYFIDVLACLLFSITLALLGARFGHEVTVPVDLPRSESPAGAGTDLTAPTIALRTEDEGGLRIYLGEDLVTLEQLSQRLEESPPPSVVVRSEETLLSSVIAAAHAAGVPDIQLAYELVRRGDDAR